MDILMKEPCTATVLLASMNNYSENHWDAISELGMEPITHRSMLLSA